MVASFEHFSRILKPRKYLVIVVGDSIVKGKLLDGLEAIKEVADKNGFRFIYIIRYYRITKIFCMKISKFRK